MSSERFRVKVPDERWFEENIGCENACPVASKSYLFNEYSQDITGDWQTVLSGTLSFDEVGNFTIGKEDGCTVCGVVDEAPDSLLLYPEGTEGYLAGIKSPSTNMIHLASVAMAISSVVRTALPFPAPPTSSVTIS